MQCEDYSWASPMPRPEPMLTPKQKFELRQMREAGISFRECGLWFNCSRTTLMRALRELREKLGPEQIQQRKQYARVHLARVNGQLIESQ